MSKYNFRNIGDQINVGSVKNHAGLIQKYFGLNYYEDSISLWVSEMDFRMSPAIEQAIKERTSKGILGYTKENKNYYKSVMSWMKYQHDTNIRKEWIVPHSGTVNTLRNALRAFTKEGDKVIIQTPVYSQFAVQIEGTKRVIANNRLIQKEGEYGIDFNQFEKLAKQEDVTFFILCNPHNPTGNVWSYNDVKRMLDITKENNVMVFADEVHAEIIREGVTFSSTITMDYDHVITAFGLGKAFNLTGIHITNLIIRDEKVRETFESYTGHSSISPITLVALDAAYNHSRDWLLEVNREIDKNLDFVEMFVKEQLPKVIFRKPFGTYLLWFDLSAYNVDTQKLTELIADGKVITESGLAFGDEGAGFIRMVSATPLERLKEALNRIKKVLNHLE